MGLTPKNMGLPLKNLVNGDFSLFTTPRQPKRTMCGFGLQRSFGRNILVWYWVNYLITNKCKNLKDMKSSCLSICTSFHYFLLFFIAFSSVLSLFLYYFINCNRLFFSYFAFLAPDEENCSTVRMYARAVKQKVWNEADNRGRDWGEPMWGAPASSA